MTCVGTDVRRDAKGQRCLRQQASSETCLKQRGLQQASASKTLPNPESIRTMKSAPDAESLRRCHEEIGRLLWTPNRTKPDVGNNVGIMATTCGDNALANVETPPWLKYGNSSDSAARTTARDTLGLRSDASFALESEKSRSGDLARLTQKDELGGAILWACQRQALMASAASEAELQSLHLGIQISLGLKANLLNLLGETGAVCS